MTTACVYIGAVHTFAVISARVLHIHAVIDVMLAERPIETNLTRTERVAAIHVLTLGVVLARLGVRVITQLLGVAYAVDSQTCVLEVRGKK